MLKKNKLLFLLIAAFVLLTAASAIYTQLRSRAESTAASGADSDSVNILNSSSGALSDNRSIYTNSLSTVREMYITVLNSSAEKDPDEAVLDTITFDKLNTLNYHSDDYNLEVILQEGDKDGPTKNLFGYGANTANGVIEIRGKSTSYSNQKSYKVTLYKSAGLWDGQKIVNFVKHPYDITHVRNAICFALMQKIPDMVSLRTQFVHLHVKDLSASKKTGQFVDYGLYEQVEQPNKKFLAAHGLDVNGNLYKAENFEFFRYEGIIRDSDDPLLDKNAFGKLLNHKVGNSNQKLIEMLDAVNDYSRNINDVVDQYFDRNNYISWVAMNILLDNEDTNTQNFYLYNPNNTNKWFFLPWDYDGALDWYNQVGVKSPIGSWHTGIAQYWNVVLHKRFFRDPDNVKQLEAKIEELSKIINKKNITALVDQIYPAIAPILKQNPDLENLVGSVSDMDKEFKRLEDIPAQQKKLFYSSLEKPMPIYLGEVTTAGDKSVFTWENSFDLQGDDLYYSFILASDPAMKKVLYRKDSLQQTQIEVPKLSPGNYYWKVTVSDSKGNTQEAFDDFTDEFNNKFFGEAKLVIS